MSTIRMKAQEKEGITQVKVLINHPMDNGYLTDPKTGLVIPAHFIQELVFEHQGQVVMNANWGGSVAQNPYLEFKFSGAKVGEKVKLSWRDNLEQQDSLEVSITAAEE